MISAASSVDDSYLYLKRLLQEEFGVILIEAKQRQIADKLFSIMLENDIDSLESLTELLKDENHHEIRANVLQAITGHSINWFHYPQIMSVFNGYIMPNFSKDKVEPYRIWVVGCGTGQMAFSLSMAADRYMKKVDHELPIDIIATDSAESTVIDAAKASYTEPMLMGLNEKDKNKYLTRSDNLWLVNDVIKSKVKFSTANLLNLDAEGMGKVDLIICPDVLAYYTFPVKANVLEKFADLIMILEFYW